jgi:hypothetical protein
MGEAEARAMAQTLGARLAEKEKEDEANAETNTSFRKVFRRETHGVRQRRASSDLRELAEA